MPNPPYSASIIMLRENADGFSIDLFHWADMPEGTPVPPGGNIVQFLTKKVPDVPLNHEQRTAATRTSLIQKFTSFVNSKFPDTPQS